MTTVTTARPRQAVHARGTAFTGTGKLMRFILRRDRIRIGVWITAITFFVVSTATAFPGLYPTAEERQARAALMTNPATLALSGPGHGLDDYTYGAMLANEMLGLTAVFVALMSVLLIVRHTRAEEAAGRAELVRATVVGRHAGTMAALLVVAAANLVLGGVLALSLGGSGVESLGWESSLLFGASLAAVGLVFAGFAALAAQLTEHSRGASGIAAAAIGLAYALRAAGDMGDGTLSWLSPIGWAQATQVYVADRWWPLLLTVALTAALVAVALPLTTRRDLGAGLVPPRPGRPAAARGLGRPLGLAVRLQRAGLIGWGLPLFGFGFVYGTLIGEVEDYVAEIEALQDLIAFGQGANVTETWISVIMLFFAMVCAAYVVLSTLRLRAEETAGRAEPVLGAAVARWQWAASHLTVALVGGVGLVLLAGLGFGISATLASRDANLIPDTLGAALVHVPALWLSGGLAFALFGLVPRLAPLAWLILVYAFVVGMFGPLLQFPDWMNNLSPFGHVPGLPAEDLTLTPLAVLTAIAVGLIVIGLLAFRGRDVGTA